MKITKFSTKTLEQRGFTIVELLIVIVVIGILAAITIVAYNGISQKAHVAVLQSDLSNARGSLEVANVSNNSYPADLSSAVIAGLKASPGTTFQYTHTTGPEGYCLTATSNGTSYYIDSTSHTSPTTGTCPLSDGTFLQTITSANCPGAMTRAVDARDNHTYWVKKLADGKCWMLTNLAYAGGGTNTYSDVDTLTNGTGDGSTTFTVPKYYIPTSGSNVTTEPTAPSTSTTGAGQYGYLYNWCAAMGGQTSTNACSSSSTPASNPATSVCPAGWRLPTGNGSGEFTALNTAVNSGSTSIDTGLRTLWFAQYSGAWDSGFYDQAAAGYYWSSSQNASSYAYALAVSSGSVSPSGADYKADGIAVRCIAN